MNEVSFWLGAITGFVVGVPIGCVVLSIVWRNSAAADFMKRAKRHADKDMDFENEGEDEDDPLYGDDPDFWKRR